MAGRTAAMEKEQLEQSSGDRTVGTDSKVETGPLVQDNWTG
jgi:hypothetical protein